MDRIFSSLYFSVQHVRGGVSPTQVAEASRLLAVGGEAMESHIRRQLVLTHGADARDPIAWLSRQPPSTRLQLQLQFDRQPPPAGVRVDWRKTSGSTGHPFRFFKDRVMSTQMDAAMWAVYGWHGLAPGQRQARFWGIPVRPLQRLRRRLMDEALARKRLGAFEISPQRSARFFGTLRRWKPEYAYGYPSMMQIFADHCEQLGLDGTDLGIRVVIATGEILSPSAKQRLEGFFNARVVNEYGCTESGILAFECEAGSMHAVQFAALTEVQRSSTLPGSAGEVLVTDLYGRALPLLRYSLNDRVRPRPASTCGCGRALPALLVSEGRLSSFIHTPAGPVYSALLAYTVPVGIQRFRVTQTAIDRLHARIVPGQGFTDSTEVLCKKTWERALPGLHVDIEVVQELPLSESGKLRYFVPLEQGEQISA